MCHLSLCFGHWPQDNVFCHLQLHGESIARGMDHLLCTLSGKPRRLQLCGGICERSGCHVVLFRWCC